MGREVLYKLFAERGFTTGAEVGVQEGYNALLICEHVPMVKLYLVDTWRRGGNRQRNRAVKRLSEYNVVVIQEKSELAVHTIQDGSLDFVYIDADHTYDMVMLDIILWRQKVKAGGILSGHDYNGPRRRGVKAAVNNYAQAHGLKIHRTPVRNWHFEL